VRQYDKTPKNKISLLIPDQPAKTFMIEMKTDHPLMHKVIIRKWPDNLVEKVTITFIHRSNGQFVLIPNRKFVNVETMFEIVKILRDQVADIDKRGRIDFSEIGKDEVIDQVPEIHIFEKTGVISNGSNVDPDVPGLIGKILSVDNVIEAVKIGLGEHYFPKKFAKKCEVGDCSKSACFLYGCGLQRCHDVRRKGREESNPLAMELVKVMGQKEVAAA